MNRAESLELLQLLEEKARRKRYNKLLHYKPYAKQIEFHNLSSKYKQRCLGAGNQLGKSLCGSMEAAYHATGLYPSWWQGAVFEKSNVGWVSGVTNDTVRKTTQKLLVGRIEAGDSELGTGSLPRHTIQNVKKSVGNPGLLDYITVAHTSGRSSLIYFMSYAMGREKFQGDTIDWAWEDEEPPQDVHVETLTRTNAGQKGQFLFMTFTPLSGMTQVVREFYEEPSKDQALVKMTIRDVDHYTEEEKESIILSYPAYIREARANGIPVLGSGSIFPVDDNLIMEKHIEDIPSHWLRINGIDFGWDHPTAAVSLAYDADTDVVHVVRAHRVREVTPVQFSPVIVKWGSDIPVSWPHDGFQHDKGSGMQLAGQYKEAGLNMLHANATHEEGGNGVEAGLFDMLQRMQDGRLKVDETLSDWFDEKRLYHRKDGKVVKMNDDLLCATRYAIMMLRYAKPITNQSFKIEFSSPFGR